jgi:acetolactate synthase regulatory subunit
MGPRQVGAVFAAALCLVAAVCASAGVGASTAAGTSSGPSTETQTQPQRITPDTVVMDVEVHENGTASWEVVYRTRLDDAESTAAFESYEADVENNSTAYSKQFVERMTGTIASAEQATGREMEGRNFDVRAEVREFPQRYGIVVYSFQWTGFADTSGETVAVGDALSGLFLNEKTRLLVSWPEGYDATAMRPEPDERRNGTAVWIGPTDFAGDEPRLLLEPPATGPVDLPWRPLAVGVGTLALVGAALVGGAWLYRNRTREEVSTSASDPPEDLLSNEERVLRLLERRGGRVKQKAVVNEFDWTEAKTSQVVGSLREQGKIESFRLGRENVLALPQERQES